MKRRLCSLVLAVMMAVVMLPVTTRAAETAVTLTAGGHYRLVNSTGQNLSVTNTGNSARYSIAGYSADGKVISVAREFNLARLGGLSIAAGGSSILTAVTGMTLTLPDGVTIAPSDHPALAEFTLEPKRNYRIADLAGAGFTLEHTGGTYDIAAYQPDGTVSAMNPDIFHYHGIPVPAGGETILTIRDKEVLCYIAYTQQQALSITETSEPAIMYYTLKTGEMYTITNHDGNKGYYLDNNSSRSRRYDIAAYRSDGTPEGYVGENSFNINGIWLHTGGWTTIRPCTEDLSVWMAYRWKEFMSFADASGAPVSYNANLTDGNGHPVEYIYDTADPGASLILPVEQLNRVTNTATATSAVRTLTGQMTSAQKSSATGTDLATLYAETATAKAARKAVNSNEVIINAAAVADLEKVAKETSKAVESALVSGGVSTARYLANTVTLTTNATGEISIKIDPDILTTEVDKIRVETPTYALTLKTEDLKADLTGILTITMEDTGAGYAAGRANGKTVVSVNLPNGKTSNPVTLSLPTDKSNTTYQAVVTTAGKSTSSKYNPATVTMDGKITASGSYTVQTNEKNFSDISNKSAEMQAAIRYLASKGIINGKTSTTFDPDGSINRAEIAALLVRALGKLDNSATNNFTDVKSSDWYYAAAGSSQHCGLIKGYNDKTFRGLNTISKVEIVAVASRVLTTEMGYTATSNTANYLSKYSDTVVSWAQKEVALATRENLIVYRTDGTFSGTKNMTRGDAAIIIYRLFQRIW